MKLWGIDLGGTKIECAVLDDNMNVVIRRRIPTEANKGYHHILMQVQAVINDTSNEINERPERIGFADPPSSAHHSCRQYCSSSSFEYPVAVFPE